MKALWVENKRCGGLHQKLHGKKATGGQWLDVLAHFGLLGLAANTNFVCSRTENGRFFPIWCGVIF